MDSSYFYNVNVMHLHSKIFLSEKNLDIKASISGIVHLPASARRGISLKNINVHVDRELLV